MLVLSPVGQQPSLSLQDSAGLTERQLRFLAVGRSVLFITVVFFYRVLDPNSFFFGSGSDFSGNFASRSDSVSDLVSQ